VINIIVSIVANVRRGNSSQLGVEIVIELSIKK